MYFVGNLLPGTRFKFQWHHRNKTHI